MSNTKKMASKLHAKLSRGEDMTAWEFKGFITEMNWTNQRAAQELDCSITSVNNWANDKQPVRRTVALACLALAQDQGLHLGS